MIGMHLRPVAGLSVLGLGLWLSSSPAVAEQPSWKCPAQAIEPCVKRHGRLSSQNGIALRIWLVGTTRMVALANDVEDLPRFAPKVPGHDVARSQLHLRGLRHLSDGSRSAWVSRRVCVAGAEKLVVQPLRGSRPAFRLLSTGPADGGRQTDKKTP